MNFSINDLYGIILFLIIMATAMYARSEYWRGKYTELNENFCTLRSENLYMRHKEDDLAAQFAEDN